jgi:microcin C transport system substrate-binding protein
VVYSTQFTNRLRSLDFDMITSVYPGLFYPSSDLKLYWGSAFINSTYNTAGVQSKAIDYLLDGIAKNQENDAALVAWGRALDRVLTWEFYVIPEWYVASYRVARWDKFGMPPAPPKYSVGIGEWWYDTPKAARIPKRY